MKTIKTLKIPEQTTHFNKNQIVFIKEISGNQACKVRGKYRGKWKWINAWIKWNDKNMHLFNIKEIKISENDYDKIMNL